LQEANYEITNTNKALVAEVLGLTRMMKTQYQITSELVSHLYNVEDKRRNSRHSAQSSHSSNAAFHSSGLPDGTDELAPELRRAREMLSTISPNLPHEAELERLSMAYHTTSSPQDSATSGSVMFSQQPGNGPPMHIMHDPFNDPRHMVYPVGQTAGIDPFHQDHIQNIPYSRPLSTPGGNAMADTPAQITPPIKDQNGSLWGGRKPRILLVEDDRTCARIGSKFLSSVDCTVEVAVSISPPFNDVPDINDVVQRDGAEAVQKVNQEPMRYDLIFMDIIMPQFDGVSATACIRIVAPETPIIAMTSNIRQEDIASYFHFGMFVPNSLESWNRLLTLHRHERCPR
jgi:osomolarity two-component system response regulator SKN7